jgi:(hydroxyamino)benzene mutase
MKTQQRRLILHGMLPFLLGLITGLFEQRFTNVRMALRLTWRVFR